MRSLILLRPAYIQGWVRVTTTSEILFRSPVWYAGGGITNNKDGRCRVLFPSKTKLGSSTHGASLTAPAHRAHSVAARSPLPDPLPPPPRPIEELHSWESRAAGASNQQFPFPTVGRECLFILGTKYLPTYIYHLLSFGWSWQWSCLWTPILPNQPTNFKITFILQTVQSGYNNIFMNSETKKLANVYKLKFFFYFHPSNF